MRLMINNEMEGDFLGRFDANDLVTYFDKLGIHIEFEEATKLVQKSFFNVRKVR